VHPRTVFVKGDKWFAFHARKRMLMQMLTPAMQLRRPDEALSRARQAVQVGLRDAIDAASCDPNIRQTQRTLEAT
jgi:hypothetical protein